MSRQLNHYTLYHLQLFFSICFCSMDYPKELARDKYGPGRKSYGTEIDLDRSGCGTGKNSESKKWTGEITFSGSNEQKLLGTELARRKGTGWYWGTPESFLLDIDL